MKVTRNEVQKAIDPIPELSMPDLGQHFEWTVADLAIVAQLGFYALATPALVEDLAAREIIRKPRRGYGLEALGTLLGFCQANRLFHPLSPAAGRWSNQERTMRMLPRDRRRIKLFSDVEGRELPTPDELVMTLVNEDSAARRGELAVALLILIDLDPPDIENEFPRLHSRVLQEHERANGRARTKAAADNT